MPRKYQKKKPPPQYTLEDIQNAVQDIVNHIRTYEQVESYYKIPKAVIYNRIKGRKTSLEKMGSGRSQILSEKVEQELENCLRARARMGCPCDKSEVQDIVAEYIEQNNIQTPFVNGRPGDDWYFSYMKRHPGLSYKKPEALQKCRKDARDPFVVYEFFEELAALIENLGIGDTPSLIFNCDESGFPTDPTKIKAIGEKGQPLTRIIGGSGRESITVLAAVSADGKCLPPFILFKGAGVQPRWVSQDDYPGTLYSCSQKGWMEEPQFFEWFSTAFVNFVKNIRETENLNNKPAVLMFDGHKSHISVRIIRTALENNIHLVKFPSHLTDVIQPLDKTVFGPLKRIWEKTLVENAKEQLNRLESGRLTKKQFGELLKIAWNKGLKPENIKKGFTCTGLYPVDQKRFPKNVFSTSALQRYETLKNSNNQDTPFTSKENEAVTKPCTTAINQNLASSSEASTSQAKTPPENLLKKTNKLHNSKEIVSPGKIIDIFAKKLSERSLEGNTAKKQVIPRLKATKYGEILTTDTVLKRLEEAEKRKLVKTTKKGSNKRKKIKYDSESDNNETELDLENDNKEINEESWITETLQENTKEIEYISPVWNEINPGVYVLVDFLGGSRKTTHYKYLCCVRSKDDDDGEITVVCLKRSNEISTEFEMLDTDVSTINFNMIIARLPDPEIKMEGRKIIYVFPGNVGVFEK